MSRNTIFLWQLLMWVLTQVEGAAVLSHYSHVSSVCSPFSQETNCCFIFLRNLTCSFLPVRSHHGLNPLKSSWVRAGWHQRAIKLYTADLFVHRFYNKYRKCSEPVWTEETKEMFFCWIVWPQVFFFLPSPARHEGHFGKL